MNDKNIENMINKDRAFQLLYEYNEQLIDLLASFAEFSERYADDYDTYEDIANAFLRLKK